MDRGYIKLFRKTLDSRVFQNEGLLKVWIWCLLKANHKKCWVSLKVGRGTTEILLQPGQFVFGRYSAAKQLKMAPSTVWKRIKKLEKTTNLILDQKRNSKRNSNYTLICITNWATYQTSGKKGDSKGDHRGTTGEPPRDTNNNVKKDENHSYCHNSDGFRLSEFLLAQILKRRNSFKLPNLQNWAKHIDDMIKIDDRNPEEIEGVIRWCQADRFWQNNILSTSKLRKQFDQLAMKMNEQLSLRQETTAPVYTEFQPKGK